MPTGWGDGHPARRQDRLEQARKLFALPPALDRVYLDRRIRDETMGEHGIEALED